MSNVIVKDNEIIRQRFTQIQKKLRKGWYSAGDSQKRALREAKRKT